MGRRGDCMKEKGDFTAGVRLFWLSAAAVIIGLVCALVATALLHLIWLFTNLFYFQEWSFAERSPFQRFEGLGWTDPVRLATILIPAVGGLVIGLMARFGSDRI